MKLPNKIAGGYQGIIILKLIGSKNETSGIKILKRLNDTLLQNKITPPQLYSVLGKLMRDGYIEIDEGIKSDKCEGARGRPTTNYILTPIAIEFIRFFGTPITEEA